MLEHILRRMGFGASPAELAAWAGMVRRHGDRSAAQLRVAARPIIDAQDRPARVRRHHDASGQPFSPNTLINDARQRWLFRMVHSQRPLEEKMALFWHNHFATAYSKIAGAVGQERATRMMDNDPTSLAGSAPGQIQMFRAASPPAASATC